MSDSDDDRISSKEDMKGQLSDCINNIQAVGSFALFESLKSTAPNPGVVVGGQGIGLPLSNNDALTIIAASHPAPFGRGTETVINPEVRKTWELSAHEFQLANPDWDEFVKQILIKVGEGMGLTAVGKKISAQLYKLLLYEEGAMFKPHQDSEKAPGMFGTLVIALPSKHEGGEVFLAHGGRKKIFETSKNSAFDFSYLAWFSDVIHEVKPITSGRRLVLTYNLIQTSPGHISSASSFSKELENLRSIFSWWKNNAVIDSDGTPEIIAHMFEHHYTEASLSFNSLKGKDLQVATYLKEAAAEANIYLCLANVTRTVVGGCDEGYHGYGGWYDDEESDDGEFHIIEDVIEEDISLVYVIDLDGSPLGRDMSFDEDNFIQEGVFEDLSPDDEEFEGHTGNEGAQATHFYHRTIAILMPRNHRVPFFLQSSTQNVSGGTPEAIKWLDSFSKDLADKPGSAEQATEDTKTVCDLIVQQHRNWKNSGDNRPQPYSDEVLNRVIQATIGLEDKTLFAEAYSVCYDKLKGSSLEFVGSAIVEIDLQIFLPKVAHAISKITSFSDRFIAVLTFGRIASSLPSYNDLMKGVISQWQSQEFIGLLTHAHTMILSSASDGKNLCWILGYVHSNSLDMKIVELIVSVVKSKIKSTLVVYGFLSKLIAMEESIEVAIEFSRPIFTTIITEVINKFDDKMVKTVLAYRKSDRTRGSIKASTQVEKKFGLSNLMCYCYKSSLWSDLDQMITKLCEEAEKVENENLDKIFPSFLRELVEILREQAISVANLPFKGFQKLYQTTLSTYIQRYVMPEPKADDWTRQEIACSTHNCATTAQLNEFLRNPTKREVRISVPVKKDQTHLFQKVGILGRRNCVLERDYRTNVFTIRKQQASSNHVAWEKRYNHAKKRIDAIESEKLKELLEECYDFIVSFSAVKRSVPIGTGSAQPASIRSRITGSVVGTARPTLTASHVSGSAIGSSRPALTQTAHSRVSANATASSSRPEPSLPNNSGWRPLHLTESWMVPCLETLRKKYPDDLFYGEMKYGAKDTNSGKVSWAIPRATPLPAHIVCSYFPSVACLDCVELEPFQSGPSRTLDTFESHLKDEKHRARVAARLGRTVTGGEAPAAQVQGQSSSSAAGGLAPLSQNRKRTVEMIDMTEDSD